MSCNERTICWRHASGIEVREETVASQSPISWERELAIFPLVLAFLLMLDFLNVKHWNRS
jgi:hypothetical protein